MAVRARLYSIMSADEAASPGGAPGTDPRARDIEWSILMARAQRGDTDAYRRLLEGVLPYLRRYVSRWHRNPGDVEDTVQDVLLTLHTIRHTYDPQRPFTPWLAAIAGRRAIDRLRRGRRAARDMAALQAEKETFSEPSANSLESGHVQEALHKAVESLPPAQRKAVTLLKLREMSLKEASAASGMSISSLKIAMHRALGNLRKKLGRRDREP